MGVVIVDAGTAFERLYTKHYAAVLRYAVRRAGPDRAGDIAAEVFTIAWRRWADLPQDDPLPWLYRTAGNVLANDRRRNSRVEPFDDLDLARIADAAKPAPESDQLEIVLLALKTLRPADQEVLRLHAWEELDGKRLAEALDCSRTAAGVRLHRARQRLLHAVDGISNNANR